MEASALTHASHRGLLARRSPLLKLQGDERLIAMARSGNAGAFETIVDRYQGRLLGFCRQMLGSTEDAEDVLQEVFVNAYRAMLADEREINLRPWLYRIARNRCLNHLRKPTADAQESMDMVPQSRPPPPRRRSTTARSSASSSPTSASFPRRSARRFCCARWTPSPTRRSPQAMDTSVPSVKSLLVRARISLAEASQARLLTCGEVRLELAEAAEGLRKVSGPVRRHVRECEECADFRSQVRSNEKVLAALFPVGPLLALKGFIASKLGFGGAGVGAAAGAGAAGAGAGAAPPARSAAVGAAISGSSAAGGIGAIGGAIGTKAVAGVVTAAVLTAGAAVAGSRKKPLATPRSRARTSRRVARATPQVPSAPAIASAHVLKPPTQRRDRRRPGSGRPVPQRPRPATPAPTTPPTPPAAVDAAATLERHRRSPPLRRDRRHPPTAGAHGG